MNWKDTLNEAWIALALIASITATCIIVIVAGADSLAPTGLKEITIALVAALAGVTVQKYRQ